MLASTHHVVPFKTYLRVLIALLVLTVLTVLAAPRVSGLDMGILSSALAVGIASIKAVLVAGYFMHLKYDDKLHIVIILSAVFFLILMFAFCWIDIYTRINWISPL